MELSDYYREKGVNVHAVHRADDVIDFDCAPCWQGYYYDRGIASFEGEKRRDSAIGSAHEELTRELLNLRQALSTWQPEREYQQSLTQELTALRKAIYSRPARQEPPLQKPSQSSPGPQVLLPRVIDLGDEGE